MFSGFVSVASLEIVGSLSSIVFVTTGMVMRKMINSTNMTSTSGVVLIVELTASSSSEPPTLIPMVTTS